MSIPVRPPVTLAHIFLYRSLSLYTQTLIYRDGILISGSLDALIQHMVPTDDYMPDKSFVFAFLLSARLFVRPHQLLERICHISDEQQAQSSLTAALVTDAAAAAILPSSVNSMRRSSNSSSTFAIHFVRLLGQWMDDFPYDFRDERLMQHVRRMTQKCCLDTAGCRRPVSAMLQSLLNRLTMLDQYELYLNRINYGSVNGQQTSNGDAATAATATTTTVNPTCPSMSTHSMESTQSSGSSATAAHLNHHHHQHNNSHQQHLGMVADITELCTGPLQLAHQLTHIELERLSHIGAEEFVQAFAKENLLIFPPSTSTSSSEDNSAKSSTASTTADIKKTRNLESYVQWFNRLSYLVASEIVKVSAKCIHLHDVQCD